MPSEEDAPRLGEINRRLTDVARTLADFRSEIRASLNDMVRRDAYVAERDGMKERIAALEARGNRHQGIMYTAIASGVIAIATLLLTRGN